MFNFLALLDIRVFGRLYLWLLIGLALFLQPGCFCLAYKLTVAVMLFSSEINIHTMAAAVTLYSSEIKHTYNDCSCNALQL